MLKNWYSNLDRKVDAFLTNFDNNIVKKKDLFKVLTLIILKVNSESLA